MGICMHDNKWEVLDEIRTQCPLCKKINYKLPKSIVSEIEYLKFWIIEALPDSCDKIFENSIKPVKDFKLFGDKK